MLKLRLIGRAAIADSSRTHLLEAKDAAWLAVLALDGPTARDALAAWLWPQAGLKNANGNLRQRIFRLRRRIGHELIDAGDTLALLPDVACDARDTANDAARDGNHNDEGLLAACEVDDCPELAAWLERQRAQWRHRRRQAWVDQAEQHEAAGNLAVAIDAAQRIVDDDPLSEHAQRRLMRLHYLRGDAAAAIAVFEAFERKLKDELGTKPGAETLALLATIERGAAPKRSVVRTPVPASLLRPPRTIGRAHELAAAQATWQADRDLVVLGEAGMGKTRLLQDLASMHPTMLLVQARPGDAGVPYAALARLLRALDERWPSTMPQAQRSELARVLPELGPAAPGRGEAQRLVLQRAIEPWLAAAHAAGMTAIAFDDLHFADAASREMLQALVASVALEPLRWCFAQRPGELGPDEVALNAGLAEAHRLDVVRLHPLTKGEMAELVASLGLTLAGDAKAWGEQLSAHTGGNPFFALETLKAHLNASAPRAANGALPRPSSVKHLIEHRLRQLSTPALALARVAAVAGADFSIELAESVLGSPALALADAWAELEAAQVLRGTAFAHDLVQDAALATLPDAIARHTHAGVAAALALRGAPAARVGRHWFEAQQWPQAAAALAQAADAAREGSLRAEEIELRELAALGFGHAGDDDAAFAQRHQRVDAMAQVHSVDEAEACADGLLLQARTPTQRLYALMAVCLVAGLRRDVGRLEPMAHEAIALATALGHAKAAAECSVRLGEALVFSGRSVEALPLLERTRTAAKGLEPRRLMTVLSTQAHALLYLDRRRESVQVLRDAIELAADARDFTEAATFHGNLAVVLLDLGRAEDALQCLVQARELRLRSGMTDDAVIAASQHVTAGAMCLRLGRYAQAIDELEQARSAFRARALAPYLARAEMGLVQLWLALGQPARAQASLSLEGEQASDVCLLRNLARRKIRAAMPSARRALEQAEPIIAIGVNAALTRLAALQRAREAPAAEAASIAADVRRAFEGAEQWAGAVPARVVQMKALAAQPGKLDEARALALVVLADSDHVVPADIYPAEVWWSAAEVLRAAGDAPSAADAMARGRAWIKDRALPNVPDAFRSSFLERNPINVALLHGA